MEAEAVVSEVKIGRLLKKYWRIRIPKILKEGASEAVLELEGQGWVVEMDKHGRVYIPSRLRGQVEKAKTIVISRRGSTVILKPRAY